MSESNPYVEARREWNDRYLELARERRWWQAVAGAEILLLLIFAVGFVWLSLQHKTVPYVVEVDSLGAALAIKPAETGGPPPSERILPLLLARLLPRGRPGNCRRGPINRGVGTAVRQAPRPGRHEPR